MEELRQLHLIRALGKIRTGMHDGREHLVVPVIALMEGVVHAVNAETPEYVPYSQLVKAANSWNGRPVTLRHPVRNGKQCSANDPEILASHGIGTIFNSHTEGKKLLMEAWIDPLKAERDEIGRKMLETLRADLPIEVSVGAYVVTDSVAGEHYGKPFKASWMDTTGDHLAFLPGGRGACSIEMGCGAGRYASAHLVTAESIELVTAQMVECLVCNGSGSKDGNPCLGCDGVGELKVAAALQLLAEKLKCAACKGTGSVEGEPCTSCSLRTAAGARHSSEDRKIIQEVHDYSAKLGAECDRMNIKFLAGRGKGNWGHAGRKGKVGGSAPKEGGGFGTWDDPGEKETTLDAIQHGIDWARDSDYSDDQVALLHSSAKKVKDGKPLTSDERDVVVDSLKQAAIEAGEDGEDEESEAYKGILKKLKTLNAIYKKLEEETAPPSDADAKGDEKTGAEEKKEPVTLKAACGCTGDKQMTPEQKAEKVKTIVSHPHSGFTAADEAMLTAASDERIESFLVAAEARAKEVKTLEENRNKQMTEEEFMRVAPSSIKTLLERTQRQETERKAELVAQLKTAQAEYAEAELSSMTLEALERMGRAMKVGEEPRSFAGRGIPRTLEHTDEILTAPDPYAAGIKTLQEQYKH